MSTLTTRSLSIGLSIFGLLGACEDVRLIDGIGTAADVGGATSMTSAPAAGGRTGTDSSYGGAITGWAPTSAIAGALTGGASSVNVGGTGNVPVTTSSGGTSNLGTTGSVQTSGGPTLATGGGTGMNSGGTAAGGSTTTVGMITGGFISSGGSRLTGGAGVTGGKASTGGTATGGTLATGGAKPTGGTFSTGGAMPTGGAVATGGVATGGALPTGGLATGGALPTGGAATGGAATGGAATGGAATGGTGPDPCPWPITKPAELRAVEPTPADQCARVSNVIKQGSDYYAFAFTNGEVWQLFTPAPYTLYRVDVWTQSAVRYSLPRALVTAQWAPANNNEGALMVGYADPAGMGIMPWFAGMAGFSWIAGSMSPNGTVLGISTCPFHGSGSHLELLVPWIVEETGSSSLYVFSSGNTGSLNQHLQLGNTSYVTGIETITLSNGWRVIAGTQSGEIYISNLLTGTITWDPINQVLSKPVSWSRITDSNMPAKWVTRIAANPMHPERIFVTFGSTNADALWFTEDMGATWSNRHSNLPTASNPDIAPPVLGASFNPLLDGAAYVVTPQTAYYTLDYGQSGWREW